MIPKKEGRERSSVVKLKQKMPPCGPLNSSCNFLIKNRGTIVFIGFDRFWIEHILSCNLHVGTLIVINILKLFLNCGCQAKKKTAIFFHIMAFNFDIGIWSPFLLMSFLVCNFVIDLCFLILGVLSFFLAVAFHCFFPPWSLLLSLFFILLFVFPEFTLCVTKNQIKSQ